MKTYLLIITLLLTSSCTRTLTVETLGVSKNITVDRDQVLQEYSKVESVSEGSEYKTTRSCESMGTCCKCGFTMSMEHECSCGIWRNCPGTQAVTLKPVTETFRKYYKVKINNFAQDLQSPLYQETYNKVLSAGSCN